VDATCFDCGAPLAAPAFAGSRCDACHAKLVAAMHARLAAAEAEAKTLAAANEAKPEPPGSDTHPPANRVGITDAKGGQGHTELAKGTGGGERVIRKGDRFS
jgi:hypothetical protein